MTVESRNVAVHEAVTPEPERLHWESAKLPAVPDELKEMVPAGVIGVPVAEVSVTVAVQVDVCPIATGESHDTVVDVVLKPTVRVADPWLVT